MSVTATPRKIDVPVQRLYMPIVERREEEGYTILEGYAYVNARTRNDKFDLTRAAMEDATDDFMKFANVREMHQPIAIGTVERCEWDDKGCRVVARIVDASAQEKCREGVYKGFSVGVKPTVLRGEVITACNWYELTVADRPADADALFSVTRMETSNETVEVEVEEITTETGEGGAGEKLADATPTDDMARTVAAGGEDLQRGTFAEQIVVVEKYRLQSAAWDTLQDVIWQIQASGSENREALVREACAEFAEYLAPIVARGEFAEPGSLQRSVATELKPVERAIDSDPEDLQRAELRGALTRLEAENGALTRRVDELAAQPTTNRPVLNVAAVERTFQQQPRTRDEIEADDAVAELKRVMALAPATTESEMLERAQTVSKLKARIGRVG